MCHFKLYPKKNNFIGKTYLGEEYNLNLISVGRDLIKLKNSQSFNANKSLVVANPSFYIANKNNKINLLDEINSAKDLLRNNINLRENWNLLPNTNKEGLEISKILKSDLLINEYASPSLIKKYRDPKILHIASHSSYEANPVNKSIKNPLLISKIPLAGANNFIKSNNDDGYLTALELSQLDLKNTELVVISGCESALGDFLLGEGIFGLKRAITLAGSRSSLLSLWKVNDKITTDFMISFYNNLNYGLNRSQALLKTQSEFRNSINPDYRHIYSWGAFQLNGDWRRINF